jgi:NAD(P)-dependent dehydrogenase (short-subunit alcohol dehydrogenase family)
MADTALTSNVLYLTGATGALGTSIRDLYLERGWRVVGFDRSEGPQIAGYSHIAADLSSEDSVESAFQRAATEAGPPRGLIATVGGVSSWKSVDEMTLDDFQHLIKLNLETYFLAARHAMRLMKSAGRGSIIGIGAEPALHPTAKKGGYIAAKAGVIALSKVIAEEGKLVGVNANCVVPVIIRTKANEEWGEAEEIPKWTDPRDIAEACYFLTSEPGHAINGSTIRIPNAM